MNPPNRLTSGTLLKREPFPMLATCSESDHIKYCIRSILLTRRGERAYSRNLGSTLMSFLFQHFQSSIVQSMRTEITQVIETFEPRVKVNSIVIERDQRDPQLIYVS